MSRKARANLSLILQAATVVLLAVLVVEELRD
jgi:hypothetical protein